MLALKKLAIIVLYLTFFLKDMILAYKNKCDTKLRSHILCVCSIFTTQKNIFKYKYLSGWNLSMFYRGIYYVIPITL